MNNTPEYSVGIEFFGFQWYPPNLTTYHIVLYQKNKWIPPPNFTEYSVRTEFFEFSVIPTEFSNLVRNTTCNYSCIRVYTHLRVCVRIYLLKSEIMYIVKYDLDMTDVVYTVLKTQRVPQYACD